MEYAFDYTGEQASKALEAIEAGGRVRAEWVHGPVSDLFSRRFEAETGTLFLIFAEPVTPPIGTLGKRARITIDGTPIEALT
jgi:hypothetical protein